MPGLDIAKKNRLSGLTAFQLKMIALVCMTIDHFAAYGFSIPIFAEYSHYLRIIGRVAAPLFLFILVQSAHHTKSKPKFILRLYVAGMSIGLFQAVTNFFLGDFFGVSRSDNIVFTFFYIVLYIDLTERAMNALKNRYLFQGLVAVAFGAISFLPYIFYERINNAIPPGLDRKYITLIQDLRDSFLPSNYHVEYGFVFIILGIILYFMRTKKLQCITFACFCIWCIGGAILTRQVGYSYIATQYFNFRQCWMLMALPFMLLYNGQRGNTCKWFFYFYYPTHRYLISVLSRIVT